MISAYSSEYIVLKSFNKKRLYRLGCGYSRLNQLGDKDNLRYLYNFFNQNFFSCSRTTQIWLSLFSASCKIDLGTASWKSNRFISEKCEALDKFPQATTDSFAKSTDSFPLVSVIIPAYNAEKFIEKTLESVVTQTYFNLEIFVIDDGSSDSTPEIVRAIAQKDPRVYLLQQTNAGVAAARNLGIQHAQGEFVAPIDADDVWAPSTIEKLVGKSQSSVALPNVVYAWSIDIDETDQPIGGFNAAVVRGDVYKILICHNFLGNASATLIRKSCLDDIGGYDTQLRVKNAQGCEDWDLYLRLAESSKFDVVPEFLVAYRKVPSGMSSDFRQMARSQQLMLENVRRKHPEIPAFLYRLSSSSFYLYIAQQCEALGNARDSLFWLWQAVKVDPITPIGRLGIYNLIIRNLSKGAFNKFKKALQKETTVSLRLVDTNQVLHPESKFAIVSIPQLPISSIKVWFKVSVSSFLNQLLRFL